MTQQKINSIRDIQPQRINANRHTERGLDLLDRSIEEDGWIGAITVAADGETFDGSARVERGVAQGFEDAIVVESDGTKPVIVKRTDIPTADDPKAIRLGINANRVGELNLDWDGNVLAGIHEIDSALLGEGFNAAELDEVLSQVLSDQGNAFLPELQPSASDGLITAGDLEKTKDQLRAQINREVSQRPFNCPHCGEEFYLGEDALK